MSDRPKEARPAAGATRLNSARTFAAAFAKAVRSYNLYARNNEALQNFLEAAHRYLEQAFVDVGDLELNVRRDRLSMLGEDVLVDADREAGIPFRLFREGIRRVTLETGLDRAELDKLVEILSRPPVKADLDDDMVCALWRADLPHFRYVTLDIYDVGAVSETDDDAGKREEIRQDLDRLLAAIYAGQRGDDESVKAVNIGADDLVALATLGEDRARETERIGQPTARAIFDIDPALVQQLQAEIAGEDEQRLLDLTFEVLLGVLFQVRSSAESTQVIQELVSMYDALLLERDFKSAASLVRQVGLHADGQDLKNVAIARQLFRLFAAPQRLGQIALSFNEGAAASLRQLTELLQLMGPDVVPGLLVHLPTVQQPQHRRALCDLMLEIQPPTVAQLRQSYGKGEWFVDRDLLYLASRSRDPAALGLLIEGCTHDHARVRQQALGSLQAAPRGEADEQLLYALEDPESAVRVTAVRTLVARRSPGAPDRVRALIIAPAFAGREAAEQRTFLVAYGALAGPAAVPLLKSLMLGTQGKGSGLLDRVRVAMETITDAEEDLRCAAAVALSSIGTPQARQALQAGASARHRRLRDVCERALEVGRGSGPGEGQGSGGEP